MAKLQLSILVSLLVLSSVPTVKAAFLPAEINKNFTPFAIIPGNISRLSVTIFNPNSFDLLNAAWSDNLIGVQPGIVIANPANMTTDCGGSAVVTALPGTTTLALSGGTVGPQVGSTPGSCSVAIDVTSTTPGNLINTIPIGALTATDSIGDSISNTSPASATLQVSTVLPPSLNKAFAPATVWAGQFSLLTINIYNNDTITTLTQTTLTDTLPLNVTIYNPLFTNYSAGCGVTASVTAFAGGSSVTLNNGSIAPLTTCSISVRVVSAVQGIYTNTIPAGPGGLGSIRTHQGVTNTLPASAQLNVQQVNLTKTFTLATVAAGATSILTITLQNPTGIDYTGVNLTDTLPVAPSVMSIAAAPAPTNTCGGTLTATAGTGVIQLTGGTIPHSLTPPTVATCVITVPVTTPATAASGALPNVIHPADMSITTPGITIPGNVTANLNIQADFTVLKSFNPAMITIGGTSTVTVTLQNHTAAAFTDVHVLDTLPLNLTVTGTPSTTCGVPPGTLTSTTTTVTLNGGTIPASATPPTPPGTCTITFQVTSTTAATYTNTIHTVDVTDDQGVSPIADVSAPITVSGTTLPVGLAKTFQTNPMAAGATSRLRITITAPADIGVTRLRVTDILPAGLLIAGMPLAPANPVTTCTPAGLLNAPVGSDTIQLGDPAALPSTGATLAAGAACTITVYVTTNTPGAYTNTIPDGTVWTAEGRTNSAFVPQTLTVTGLQVSKAFYPNTIAPNGLSTLTITLTNTSPSWLINVSARDRLPTMGGNGTTTGVVISGTPNASTDCGGTITFPDTRTIQLTGGSIKPQAGIVPGTCVIHVNVRGLNTAGLPVTRTNTISRAQPDVTADVQGGAPGTLPTANATATLTITTLTINVVKGFSPLTVFGGSFSTLSVQLLNTNNSVLTGIAFADTMPTGMFIANPSSLNVGTCGGTLAGIPGSATFSFSGGTLLAASNCTLTLSVSMNVNGNLTNTILANSVSTFNGATNTQNADASLTNLPGVSVSKFFSPNPIVIGVDGSSLLTITIQNTGSASLVGLGLTDNLPGTLPAGLEIVGSPAPVNHCGGTFNAVAGTQVIELIGGTIAGSASCTIEVSITGPTIGNYQNCIPIGAISDDQGISNTEPACDTLKIIEPDLTITKANNVGGNLILGNSFIWTLTTANIGTADSTFTNGQTIIRDPLPAGATYGSPTPGGFTNITNPGNIVCSIDGSNILTCTANGASVTLGATTGSFTVTYGVTPTAAGALVNTATVDYDNNVTESNETNNTSTDTVTVTAPDLTVIKTDNVTGPLYVGNTFTWRMHVANSGRTASFSNGNVVLRDPLPIGATYANLTGPTPAVTGLTCAIDGLNVITCTAGVGGVTLAAGATFDVLVDVTPTVAGGLTNTATVDYGNNIIESSETNNTGTDSVTVIAYASLGDFVWNDVNANGIQDAGESGIPNVTVHLYDSTSTQIGTTSTDANGLYLFSNLTPGDYHVGFVASAGYHFSPQDQGSNDAVDSDANPATGLTAVTTLAVDETDLTWDAGLYQPVSLMITKTDGITSVNTGDSTTYMIRATNNGPGSVTGAILSDPAAAGLSKTAVACSATPGQCLTAPTIAQLEGGTFALPAMNAGQYYEITVTAIVTATNGSVTNTATVTPPPGTTDLTSGDNTDSDTDTLTAMADLEVTKTDGVSSVLSGETLTYTVRATNKGPSSVSGATLSDIAGVELTKTAVACSATPGQCVTAPTVTELESGSLALPALNKGQYYEITVTAIVTATSGSVTNVATVAPPSGIADPTPDDNSDTDADVMTLPPQAVIPNTGFAPGRVSILPEQPAALTYAKMGDFWLEVPSLGVQMTIVGVPQTAGKWDVSWLGRQAGWLNATAYPGSTGNSVITGHVYLPNGKAGPFVNLRTLKWGDRVIIHSPDGQMYVYEVREVERVLPNDITVFRHEERSWITLVTCQGYNQADNTYSYRTVVRAVLISVKPDPAKNPK